MANDDTSIVERAKSSTPNVPSGIFNWAWARSTGSWLVWTLVVVAIVFVSIGGLFGLFGCFEAIPFPGAGDKQAKEIGCAANAAMRIFQIGGFMLGFTATMADFTLNRFIFRMGEYIGEGSGIGFGIKTGWEVVRNLTNLAFIGGLIWAAISLILQTGQQVGKLVVQIIIAALLVNFSYFFAGVVIDASNTATQIVYREAIYEEGDVYGLGTPGEPDKHPILTTKFMNATRLSSVYDFQNFKNYVTVTREVGWSLLILSAIGLGLFAATAWAFLTISVLFLNRFITIIILLITSPVGVLRFSGIPTVNEWGKWWWSALFSQAIFPPVFFIMLALSFKIIETMNQAVAAAAGGTPGSFTDLVFSPEASTINAAASTYDAMLGIYASFAIAIGLIYASVKVSTNIAKQIPTSPPTTAAIYDFRKTAIPALVKGVTGGAQLVAGIGKLPALFDSNRMYRNLGDQLFRGNILRDNILGPLQRQFDPVAGRDFEVSRGRIKAYYDALNTYLAAVEKYGKNSTQAQDAFGDAIEKYQLLKEPERNEVDNIDMQKRSSEDPEAENAHRQIKRNASENVALVRNRVTQAQVQAPQDSKTQDTLKEIDRDIRESDTREAARDKLVERQALLDMAQEKEAAAALLQVARNSRFGVSVLPMPFLTHENVRPHLTMSDLAIIASDEKISNDDFNKIADVVGDAVHDEFVASPAAKMRPERKPRVPTPPPAREQEKT